MARETWFIDLLLSINMKSSLKWNIPYLEPLLSYVMMFMSKSFLVINHDNMQQFQLQQDNRSRACEETWRRFKLNLMHLMGGIYGLKLMKCSILSKCDEIQIYYFLLSWPKLKAPRSWRWVIQGFYHEYHTYIGLHLKLCIYWIITTLQLAVWKLVLYFHGIPY